MISQFPIVDGVAEKVLIVLLQLGRLSPITHCDEFLIVLFTSQENYVNNFSGDELPCLTGRGRWIPGATCRKQRKICPRSQQRCRKMGADRMLDEQSTSALNQQTEILVTPGAEGLQPAGQRVFDAILKAIYEQRVKPGTKLGEEALAAFFSVGRGHIRRALLALSHQKVIELIPNRGAFVTRPTEADARDIFNARRLLEEVVVR
jgi:DNA-binding transcriptional regulator YhcF (GntR family)